MPIKKQVNKPDLRDLVITDLKIPGKRGPFWLRMLEFDEAFALLFNTSHMADTPLIVTMAAACLTNAQGAVYGVENIDKMKHEIRPAPTLMALGLSAYRLNDCDAMLKLGQSMEDATKN